MTATAEGVAGAPQLLRACAVGVLLGPGEWQRVQLSPWALEVKSGKGGALRKRAGPWVRALLFLREMEPETEGETGGGGE